MDNVLVTVGLISVAIVVASLTPRPRIWRSKPINVAGIPPPLPQDPAKVEQAADGEREPNEIDEAAMAKARDLVSKSGVDSAACDILGLIQYWPIVLDANKGEPALPFRAVNEGRMPAQHPGERDGRWVNWLWDGIAYRLELWMSPENSAGFEDDLNIGDLRLWVGGEAVMHLNVLKRAEVQHDRWTPFGVSSLRAGSWMLRLNELAACLRTADQPHDEGAKPNASTFIDRKGPRW
jgi:hypothetical protein